MFRRSYREGLRHRRCRRRKRYHFACLVLLLTVAATAAVMIITTMAQPEEGPTADPAENAAPAIHIAVARQSDEVKQKKKAQGLLVLVNWDNPTDGTRPEGLVTLDSVFQDEVAMTNAEELVNQQAAEAARRMFLDATKEGIGPYKISSAYRSEAYQEKLWQARLEQDPNYGSDPYHNPVKAMPGNMSEHATGLAIDILSVEHERANDEYGQTEEGRWLAKNAHKYGFILRYPKDKENITGVIYEPWHFRYVGIEDATIIYQRGICLEEYVQP